MSTLNPDQISLIISKMSEEFAKIYLTKEYFGDFPDKDAEVIRLFLNGYCAIFALALKKVIPEASFYLYQAEGKHILINIYNYFYDIRGLVAPSFLENGSLEKINDVFEVPSVIPEDYLFSTNSEFYETLIIVLAQAGLDYEESRGWTKVKKLH